VPKIARQVHRGHPTLTHRVLDIVPVPEGGTELFELSRFRQIDHRGVVRPACAGDGAASAE
jgi:hypothetical protein